MDILKPKATSGAATSKAMGDVKVVFTAVGYTTSAAPPPR